MTKEEMIKQSLSLHEVPEERAEEFIKFAMQLKDPAAELQSLTKAFRLGFTEEQLNEVVQCSCKIPDVADKVYEIAWRRRS